MDSGGVFWGSQARVRLVSSNQKEGEVVGVASAICFYPRGTRGRPWEVRETDDPKGRASISGTYWGVCGLSSRMCTLDGEVSVQSPAGHLATHMDAEAAILWSRLAKPMLYL